MRTAFLDRLRVVLTALVIAHHTAITYGASGSWFFKASGGDEAVATGLTLFAAINQAFFMGFFFLIAGRFTPGSLARKGRVAFLRDRVIRLGLPIVLFGFLLGPLTAAIAASARGEEILPGVLGRVAAGEFLLGPLWFALALLIFSVGAAALSPPAKGPAREVPGPRAWAPAAAGVGAAALAIRQWVPVGESVAGLQLGYFASYVFLFALGCVAARHGWLERIGRREALPWGLAAGVAALALPAVMLLAEAAGPVVVETGFSGPAVFYAFWEPVVAWGIIALLLWKFRERGNGASARWSWAAGAAYGAFIVHPPVIVALAVSLEGAPLPALVKFVVVAATGTALSFMISGLLRSSAAVRQVI